MCNRYGYLAPVSRLIDEFSHTRLPLIFPDGGVPNLAPRAHIRPTERAPIIRALDAADPAAGVTLVEARWWLIPFFHKGAVKDWKPMCTNARAETVATTPTFREPFRRRRCLIPASCYYEWTGEKGAKVMWRFTRAQADLFCFAGLWDRAQTSEGPIESFTIITCAAGEDTAAYHNRAPVILNPDAWSAWLTPGADSAALLRPLAPRSIEVALA
jgi:putative SOS response-associated peptidase YedK